MTDKVNLAHDDESVWPNDYDWETYFAIAVNANKEINVNVATDKLRGLALSYVGLLETLRVMAEERGEMLKSVGVLLVENESLKQQLIDKPVKPFAVGDDVKVNTTGEKAYIQFIEPNSDNIWIEVLGTHDVVLKHSHDLVYY
jgi:hypothetical protein